MQKLKIAASAVLKDKLQVDVKLSSSPRQTLPKSQLLLLILKTTARAV